MLSCPVCLCKTHCFFKMCVCAIRVERRLFFYVIYATKIDLWFFNTDRDEDVLFLYILHFEVEHVHRRRKSVWRTVILERRWVFEAQFFHHLLGRPAASSCVFTKRRRMCLCCRGIKKVEWTSRCRWLRSWVSVTSSCVQEDCCLQKLQQERLCKLTRKQWHNNRGQSRRWGWQKSGKVWLKTSNLSYGHHHDHPQDLQGNKITQEGPSLKKWHLFLWCFSFLKILLRDFYDPVLRHER